MAVLNSDTAIKYAKDLTETSIEHELIVATNDPVQTAKNVYAFYKTLYENLSGKTVE